ncbi:MAG: thioredoxin-like domain-containing protein, partial [Flavobacteriaceae bacterium]
ILKNNNVLYFWPKDYSRIENMTKRVRYLAHKFPDINFIGVDSQLDHDVWKTYVNKTRSNKNKQFQINEKVKDVYFTDGIPRAILLDKFGKIKSDYTYLTQSNFESKLLLLQKNN